MEFYQPPTENVGGSPYPYGTPKFRFIFMKRCVIELVQITNSLLATFGCHGGYNNPPAEGEG